MKLGEVNATLFSKNQMYSRPMYVSAGRAARVNTGLAEMLITEHPVQPPRKWSAGSDRNVRAELELTSRVHPLIVEEIEVSEGSEISASAVLPRMIKLLAPDPTKVSNGR